MCRRKVGEYNSERCRQSMCRRKVGEYNSEKCRLSMCKRKVGEYNAEGSYSLWDTLGELTGIPLLVPSNM